MMPSPMQSWKYLPCLRTQLQLRTTLTGGQSFRWKEYKTEDDSNTEQFIGLFGNILWILKQNDTHLLYRVVLELPYPQIPSHSRPDADAPAKKKSKIAKANTDTNPMMVRMKVAEPERKNVPGQLYDDKYYEALLHSYFRLDVNLEEHYNAWAKAHAHFESQAVQFYAVRMLNQDPVENLFSFICSQNNNISRISQLVEKICAHWGQRMGEFEGITYHAFPPVSALSPASVETKLRELSFGYRAKYIQSSAAEIQAKGDLVWFQNLQSLSYKDAHTELISLTGIGPKVADCICLMSLDHLQAIPVDTHVFQIAKHYLPHLATAKAVTSKMYPEIGDKFREIYGPLAGWAQTILFCADLQKFKDTKNQPAAAKKGKRGKKKV